MWFDVCAIAYAFRWEVALVGEFFYWTLLTTLWDPFLVQGVYRETTLRQGRDCEGGRHVALSNNFCKSVLCKRIFIKFFWTIV